MIESESVFYWQEKLGIVPGMSKQEVLEKFLAWQENKKTCERCEGIEYFDFCPIRFVCQEARESRKEENEDESNRGQIDIRSGFDEEFGLEEIGIGKTQERERIAICQILPQIKSIFFE